MTSHCTLCFISYFSLASRHFGLFILFLFIAVLISLSFPCCSLLTFFLPLLESLTLCVFPARVLSVSPLALCFPPCISLCPSFVLVSSSSFFTHSDCTRVSLRVWMCVSVRYLILRLHLRLCRSLCALASVSLCVCLCVCVLLCLSVCLCYSFFAYISPLLSLHVSVYTVIPLSISVALVFLCLRAGKRTPVPSAKERALPSTGSSLFCFLVSHSLSFCLCSSRFPHWLP